MADGSKTEQATAKRREKARERGQIARSRELPGVCALTAVVGVVILITPSAASHWVLLYRATLYAASSGDISSNGPFLFWSAIEVTRWSVPILCSAMLFSALAGLAQGGFNIAPEAMTLKFERLNPAGKLGQIFSPVGVSNLLKSLLPFGVIIWIIINVLRGSWETLIHSSTLGLKPFMVLVGSMVEQLMWKVGLVLLAWAAVDYVFTWKKMNNDLKMSKQEVRQEYRETEGNPLIRSRVRQLRWALRKKQILQAAATATVVVTNPTHYAVALRYMADMPAPVVVAKGRNLLAEKIKQLARDSGIMLVENKPLAQALYKAVDVGESIPSKLYQAVAELLALVFRAQAELRRKEARSDTNDVDSNASRNTSMPSTPPAGGMS